jgi:hypothetical protein
MAYNNQNDSSEFDYTPGFTKNTHEYGVEFGDEFHAPAVAELLASMVAYTQRGVTLAAGQGVLPTGCLLAKHTATGKYYVANVAATDGRQTVLGVLRDGRDTGGSGGAPAGVSFTGQTPNYPASPAGKVATDCQANLVIRGTLNLSLLSGTDTTSLISAAGGGFGSAATSGAVAQLGGRVVNFGNGIGTPPFGGSAMDNSSKAVFIF